MQDVKIEIIKQQDKLFKSMNMFNVCNRMEDELLKQDVQNYSPQSSDHNSDRVTNTENILQSYKNELEELQLEGNESFELDNDSQFDVVGILKF